MNNLTHVTGGEGARVDVGAPAGPVRHGLGAVVWIGGKPVPKCAVDDGRQVHGRAGNGGECGEAGQADGARRPGLLLGDGRHGHHLQAVDGRRAEVGDLIDGRRAHALIVLRAEAVLDKGRGGLLRGEAGEEDAEHVVPLVDLVLALDLLARAQPLLDLGIKTGVFLDAGQRHLAGHFLTQVFAQAVLDLERLGAAVADIVHVVAVQMFPSLLDVFILFILFLV